MSLSSLNYTGKMPYNKLRGTLPTGFRILSKKQNAAYNRAKAKLRQEQKAKERVAVQLHRNERVLDFVENAQYKAVMKKAKMKYKK